MRKINLAELETQDNSEPDLEKLLITTDTLVSDADIIQPHETGYLRTVRVAEEIHVQYTEGNEIWCFVIEGQEATVNYRKPDKNRQPTKIENIPESLKILSRINDLLATHDRIEEVAIRFIEEVAGTIPSLSTETILGEGSRKFKEIKVNGLNLIMGISLGPDKEELTLRYTISGKDYTSVMVLKTKGGQIENILVNGEGHPQEISYFMFQFLDCAHKYANNGNR